MDIQLAAFAGINNRLPQERLTAADLVTGSNVVIGDSSNIEMREGRTLLLAGSYHSVWANNDICLLVQGTALKRLLPDNSVATVRNDMSGERVSYDDVAGTVYYSDNSITGAIAVDGEKGWGLPQLPPPVATVSSGSLPAGVYQFCAVSVDDDLREGGVTEIGSITLSAPGSITFSADASSSVYVSPTNDSELYLLSTNETSVRYDRDTKLSTPLQTLNKIPPMPGHIVSHYRGHMLIARDSFLFYSDPYRYHLFDWRQFLPIGARLTMVAPVKDGLFIGTPEATYFAGGTSPDKMELISVANYGVAEGTLVYVDKKDTPYLARVPGDVFAVWTSPQGVCIGGDGGFFLNLSGDRMDLGQLTERGAAVAITMRGSLQYITSIR
jgi:hypothetical protein